MRRNISANVWLQYFGAMGIVLAARWQSLQDVGCRAGEDGTFFGREQPGQSGPMCATSKIERLAERHAAGPDKADASPRIKLQVNWP